MWNMAKPASSSQWGWLMGGSAAGWLQTGVPRLGCGGSAMCWGGVILASPHPKAISTSPRALGLLCPTCGDTGVHLITLCWDEMLNKVLGHRETKSHPAMSPYRPREPSWIENSDSDTLRKPGREKWLVEPPLKPVLLSHPLAGAERCRSVEMRTFKFNADGEIFLLLPAESRCCRFTSARHL